MLSFFASFASLGDIYFYCKVKRTKTEQKVYPFVRLCQFLEHLQSARRAFQNFMWQCVVCQVSSAFMAGWRNVLLLETQQKVSLVNSNCMPLLKIRLELILEPALSKHFSVPTFLQADRKNSETGSTGIYWELEMLVDISIVSMETIPTSHNKRLVCTAEAPLMRKFLINSSQSISCEVFHKHSRKVKQRYANTNQSLAYKAKYLSDAANAHLQRGEMWERTKLVLVVTAFEVWPSLAI